MAHWGFSISAKSVARILGTCGYSLKANNKCLESGSGKTPLDPKERDQQFHIISALRKDFANRNQPVISVDAKARELVGPFYQPGSIWTLQATKVLDHDFPSDATGVALPYGIYDLTRNEGFINLGTSYETGQFAVDSVKTWWKRLGSKYYPEAEELLILADCGKGNGSRNRLWKTQLQYQIADQLGLRIRICHYPRGTSKWNPIEHRLFCHISSNWSGQPLTDHNKMISMIRSTTTQTGLKVHAVLNKKTYPKGIKIKNKEINQLNLTPGKILPQWNYTIAPQC